MMSITPDLAAKIFQVANETDRAGELWDCLTTGGSATIDKNGWLVTISGELVASLADHEDEEDEPVLSRDGRGIERVPIGVSYSLDGGTSRLVDDDPTLCIVRIAELEALEDLIFDAREIVALLCPNGIHWDSSIELEALMERGEALWSRMTGVLRGDNEQ